MEYLFDIDNYVSWASLGNRLPFEAFWRETPDISMILFKFWEPVYYRNWTDKAGFPVRINAVKAQKKLNRGTLVKKTFDNSNQDYPGVRNERKVMPKKSAVVRFPSLSDPMPGICCNKEKNSVGMLDNTHAGKSLGPCILGLKV